LKTLYAQYDQIIALIYINFYIFIYMLLLQNLNDIIVMSLQVKNYYIFSIEISETILKKKKIFPFQYFTLSFNKVNFFFFQLF